MLDWSGRQIRKNKADRVPEGCAPILERLDCSPEFQRDLVNNFQLRFREEACPSRSRLSFSDLQSAP